MKQYLTNVAIGFDQLLTTIVGGWPDETLSSYAYRLELQGKLGGRIFRPVIDWLFKWQKLDGGHCRAAWVQERTQGQLPPGLRSRDRFESI